MRHPRNFLFLALAIQVGHASPPAMRTLRNLDPMPTLLRDGGFESLRDGQTSNWSPARNGIAFAPVEGRLNSVAIRCTNTNATEWTGASQTLQLNRTNVAPFVVRGWSKSEQVSGSPDSGYSLYVDLVYQDGTPLWGQTANFRCGSHGWQEKQVVIFPAKPVKTLTLHCLLRGHSGTAWFDDIRVEELGADTGSTVLDGVPVIVEPRPASRKASDQKLSGTYQTHDGLSLRLVDGAVASIRAGRAELEGQAPSGFMVRDVAANSDFYDFESGACPELGLSLEAKCLAGSDQLRIEGRVLDTSGKDRAVTLYFALPIKARGWNWGDDIRRSRVMQTGTEYANLASSGSGSTGTMSLYPCGGIWNEREGLAIGLDMDRAAQFRIFCNPGTGQFVLAYDFGLAADTERFPSGAEFAFVLYRFEPGAGFRAAFSKFMGIFPEHFRVRSQDQGIWMPFTDVSTVQGWEDFGFKYHEGVNNVPWDDRNGVLSFRYTEPMTWWMRMAKKAPRTYEEAKRVRDALASGPDPHQAQMARLTKIAGMQDDTGEAALSFRDTPWCDGAVWSINPNPYLPAPEGEVNGATVYWNHALKEGLYGRKAKGQQDGEYLDSLEGYVTADLNFRREHFRHTTVPLTFTTDTRQLTLSKGLAVYEFTKWLSEDAHRLGKLMFANGVPYHLTFLCPWLDVMGTETDWLRDGKYVPASDEQMCLWRTMSGQKPYLLLMNTDYNAFTPDLVERYFQRSLFYGMFPSMFSHNAADNPYWQNPAWYNRDRALFKKYIPLVKTLSSAGWAPVTRARCDNPALYVERFGPGSARFVYFTLLNDTARPQTGGMTLDVKGIGANKIISIRELTSGQELPAKPDLEVTLQSQQCKVFEVRW